MPTNGRGIVVFLGPTVPRREAQALLAATYLPPVQQGSVLQVAEDRLDAIVLIDGYFSWVPSVWHKEILWALERGIRVFGASSMGALRAAELHPFGMVGHGTVFDDFVSGRLEDDDEVAIMHADAEFDYRPLSDAMVNIRYTLAAADAQGVISTETARTLTDYCKQHVFYDRLLTRLVRDARDEQLLTEAEAQRLADWLPANARDVKREDAEALLRLLADGELERERPRGNGFAFEPTANWLQLRAAVRARNGTARLAETEAGAPLGLNELLTECRVAGDWPAFESMALARLLAASPTSFARAVDNDEYLTELARLCILLGLDDLDQLAAWAESVGWGSDRLARVVEREALLERAREACGDVDETVGELLVLTNQAERFARRAAQKRRWRTSTVGLTHLDTDPGAAIAAFSEKVGAPPGGSDDLLARRHGWPSVADMAEDLLLEQAFCRATAADRDRDDGRASNRGAARGGGTQCAPKETASSSRRSE